VRRGQTSDSSDSSDAADCHAAHTGHAWAHRICGFAVACKTGKEKQLMAPVHTLKRHPVVAYFVLVYALSWACWIPPAIARTWLGFPYLVFAVAGVGMPGLLGILLSGLLGGKTGVKELFGRLGRARAPLRWYAVVLLLIPALQLAAAGIPALLGLATITFAFSGFTVLGALSSALLEELGWRRAASWR
jgi:hypothetical protein